MDLTRNRCRARRQPRRPEHRPGFDRLESRIPLSIGNEFPVNVVTPVEQSHASVATNASGRTVVVWRDVSSANESSIKARIYHPAGFPLTGELIVNNTSNTFDTDPNVAINAAGSFVVAWTRRPSRGGTDIRMAQFNAAGQNIKGLNSSTLVTPSTQPADAPTVGIDGAGNALVVYEVNSSTTPPILNYDLYARRYSASGTFLGQVTIAATGDNEFSPSVGELSNGAFALAYTKQPFLFSGNPSVVVRTYQPNGAPISAPMTLSGVDEYRAPSVSLQGLTNGVVAYQKRSPGGTNDIKARLFTLWGGLTPEINVRNTSAQETTPAVAMTTGRRFVVAYVEDTSTVRVTELKPGSSGFTATTRGPFSLRARPAVAIDSTGHYTVAYQTYVGAPGADFIDLRARRGLI